MYNKFIVIIVQVSDFKLRSSNLSRRIANPRITEFRIANPKRQKIRHCEVHTSACFSSGTSYKLAPEEGDGRDPRRRNDRCDRCDGRDPRRRNDRCDGYDRRDPRRRNGRTLKLSIDVEAQVILCVFVSLRLNFLDTSVRKRTACQSNYC